MTRLDWSLVAVIIGTLAISACAEFKHMTSETAGFAVAVTAGHPTYPVVQKGDRP